MVWIIIWYTSRIRRSVRTNSIYKLLYQVIAPIVRFLWARGYYSWESKGIINEIGIDHIRSVVSHPNVEYVGISCEDIEESIKLDEEQALAAAELEAELGGSSAGSELSDPLDSDDKENIFAGASPLFYNESDEPCAKSPCYDGNQDPFMGASFDPSSLFCSELLDF